LAGPETGFISSSRLIRIPHGIAQHGRVELEEWAPFRIRCLALATSAVDRSIARDIRLSIPDVIRPGLLVCCLVQIAQDVRSCEFNLQTCGLFGYPWPVVVLDSNAKPHPFWTSKGRDPGK
jgi:hypothetical protein